MQAIFIIFQLLHKFRNKLREKLELKLFTSRQLYCCTAMRNLSVRLNSFTAMLNQIKVTQRQ